MYHPTHGSLLIRARFTPTPSIAAVKASLNQAGYHRDESVSATNPRNRSLTDSGCYTKRASAHPPVECAPVIEADPTDCQYRVFAFRVAGGEVEVYGRYETVEQVPLVTPGVFDPTLESWLTGAAVS